MIAVTSRARVRWATRFSGEVFTSASSASTSSRVRNVKNLRYITTSRSSVFSQNW